MYQVYIPHPQKEQKAQHRLRERHTHSATVIAQRGACNNYGQRYRGCSCCLMDIESLMIRRPFGSIDPNSIRETELHTECRRRRERESLYSPQHDRGRDAARQRAAATRTRENDEARAGRCVCDCRCCPSATVRAAVVFVRKTTITSTKNNKINRKTSLCHHRPQTESHSNEYVNSTPKAEQALPPWRGVGRSSRDTKPLLSSSDGARSCRIRLRFPLQFC